ncbi:hypothetical protein [Gordonia jinhuaensis]|uniref:hypothetical protein n=1 Tax=Gordonia jinhuaensis TaxID=1517702 RepID=UPI001663991C|nr:hypothetical protein [Gordonia jinhuaensis]
MASPSETDAVLIVGGQLHRATTLIRSWTVLATLDNGIGVDNEEQGIPVALCERPHDPKNLWPTLRRLGRRDPVGMVAAPAPKTTT